MAVVNGRTQLFGDFKQVYSEEGIISLVEDYGKLLKMMGPVQAGERIGESFIQPVALQTEQGFTYAASGDNVDTLLAPVAGSVQRAVVEASQLYGRTRVSYEALLAAKNKGPQAFMDIAKLAVEQVATGAIKRREIMVLHGTQGWGTVGAISGTGTTRLITIATAEWSGAIWAATENGCLLDAYNNATSSQTQVNTNAAITITGVDLNNKQISVSGNSTDLTALDAATNAVLYPRTGSFAKEAPGIGAILANSTGTLFNLSATTYSMWGGNQYAVGGALSLTKILKMISLPATYGAPNHLVGIVAPEAFEVLNSDQSTLRRYGADYRSKGENGFESLSFYAQNGYVEIIAHPLQKLGKIYIFPPKQLKRIGASGIGFITRQDSKDPLILETGDGASSEMRIASNEAILLQKPRCGVVGTGITY